MVRAGLEGCLEWCLRASRAQLRQRVAEAGALGDWASHLGLNLEGEVVGVV